MEKKKIPHGFALTLALCFVFGLIGCDAQTETAKSTPPAAQSETGAETPAHGTENEETAESETAKTGAAASFEARTANTSRLGTLRYWLYTPSDPTDEMPLIVYLHSASGKGDDLALLTTMDGLPKWLQNGALGDVRAYVVMPQLPAAQRGWVNVSADVIELIDQTIAELPINAANVALSGHSVGGTGTWNIALAYPERFARIAPLSGSVRVTAASVETLKTIPVRAFAGAADAVIDPALSVRMVETLQSVGADAEVTVFEETAHEAVPAHAFLDNSLGLINWLTGDP